MNLLLTSERRNIYLFYILTASTSCWFVTSNWIYFWTKYMTFGQLGWVDAIGFGFALLLEIPSGAIADLLGKKITIFTGMLAGAIGIYIITFSGTLTGIFIGWLITQISFAFFSGAGEALTYDTLVDLKQEEKFDKVITKASEIESWTTAIATVIGGFLYTTNFRLPSFLWGTAFAVGTIVSCFLVEPKIDTEKFSFKIYLGQLLAGIKELTQTGLKRFIGFFFILVGVYYMYAWGFIRPAIATSFGFFSKEQAIILPILTILGALVVRSIPWLKQKISDINGLFFLSLMMAAGFTIASFPVGYWGLISLILVAIAGKLASPWISIVVNKRIESKHRATTLSTVALLTKIPYVLIAVLAGKMIEKGTLPTFNLATGIIVIGVASLSLILVYLKDRFKYE